MGRSRVHSGGVMTTGVQDDDAPLSRPSRWVHIFSKSSAWCFRIVVGIMKDGKAAVGKKLLGGWANSGEGYAHSLPPLFLKICLPRAEHLFPLLFVRRRCAPCPSPKGSLQRSGLPSAVKKGNPPRSGGTLYCVPYLKGQALRF